MKKLKIKMLCAGFVLAVLFLFPVLAQAKDKDTYTIFVSGIDTREDIIEDSRSDSNILVVGNVRTHELLILFTPRDYFVPLSISDGVPDKLTHAGIYGVQVSMDTRGMLDDIDIQDYLRINFDGVVRLIDSMGGITVYSDYEFDGFGYHFQEGENQLDGDMALAFARERFSFEDGDLQRGANQMELIKQVLQKVAGEGFWKILSEVVFNASGAYETNLSLFEMGDLFLNVWGDFDQWNVTTYSVTGTGDYQVPYSMNETAYVMIPDTQSVDYAKSLIQKVKNGEFLPRD